MSKFVTEVNEAEFDAQVRSSQIPVVVDFWAPWCGPCRMLAPVLEEVGGQYEGKVKIVKVNVDENSSLASQNKIMSIPTLLLFKDGKEYSKQVGAVSKQDLVKKVEELIG